LELEGKEKLGPSRVADDGAIVVRAHATAETRRLEGLMY
jgi:hypothetical protein